MTNKTKKLTSADIKYLLTIKEFTEKANGVRSASIAKEIQVTRPSAHAKIKSLISLRLLQKDDNGLIHLTGDGFKIADCFSEYYNVLSNYLNPIFANSADKKSIVCAMLAEMQEDDIADACNRIMNQ